MKIEIELTEEQTIELKKVSHHFNMLKSEYIESIIRTNLSDNVYLEYGYVYDKRKKVLMLNDELIYLNNLEEQLFTFLIENIGNYVSSEEIIANVIKAKPMSLFSMRNIIRHIREKTNRDLILSRNNIGYKINKLEFN